MKLIFNLDYQTICGEDVVLHINDSKLDFLDADAKYRAMIYEDGPDADFETNPYPMAIRQIDVTSDSTLQLRLARSGGAAIRIEKQ